MGSNRNAGDGQSTYPLAEEMAGEAVKGLSSECPGVVGSGGASPEELQRVIASSIEGQLGEVLKAGTEGGGDHHDSVVDHAYAMACEMEPLEALQTIASLAVREIADWCVIDEVVSVAEGRAKRMVVAHRDPEFARTARAVETHQPRNPAAAFGAVRVASEGCEHLISSVTDRMVASITDDPNYRSLLETLEIRSYFGAPLVCNQMLRGAMGFVTTSQSGRLYHEGSGEIHLGRRLAKTAAMVLCNIGDPCATPSAELSDFEVWILRLRDSGKTTEQIASITGAKISTLRNIHYRSINSKLGTERINYASAVARQQGRL